MGAPATRIGILGGGQLGLMLAEAAPDLGVTCAALDAQGADAPASRVVDVTAGDVSRREDVVRFGSDFDVVTIEVERVSAAGMRDLEARGVVVHPSARVVETIQDKGTQKAWLAASGFPTSAFATYPDAAGLREAVAAGVRPIPFVQKARREGYDGRGVVVVREEADLAGLLDVPCVAEDLVAIATEVAVVVARGRGGAHATFDPVEMVFRPGANILDVLVCPARIPDALAAASRRLAVRVAEAIDIVGVLAVEMFVDTDGELWVNELAPRPHNSGHHTIEACTTSQYGQHLRAISGRPLGATEPRRSAVLVNVLGAPGIARGTPRYLGRDAVEAMPGVHLHLYGKRVTWSMRKMGHVTIVDDDVNRALATAVEVRNTLRVASDP
ncbi:MAG: 5-(carboxyamino)imidazole ribonucleotide synthase [Myxococcota bacterium]